MVFQRFNLFPHLTRAENIVEAPVLVRRERARGVRRRARDLLEMVGLADKAGAYPDRNSPAASSSASPSPGRWRCSRS